MGPGPSDMRIRTMAPEDVNVMLDWAAAEGWNPGLHDGAAFYAADPEGFLIGELDGRPAATISAVVYEQSFGFLGFYIVPPELRGKGLGYAIWGEAMKRFGDYTVGLDGVPEQQDNYRKSGFELAHRNVRFGGSAPATTATRPVPLDRVPFDAVQAYDRQTFPAARGRFLRAWLAQPESRALGLVEDGNLTGFGVIRHCREGFKVGPLLADTPDGADELFRGLTGPVSGQPVFLDVPETHLEAVGLAERYGLAPAFETARMYRGPFPAIDLAKVFGITTFELG